MSVISYFSSASLSTERGPRTSFGTAVPHVRALNREMLPPFALAFASHDISAQAPVQSPNTSDCT